MSVAVSAPCPLSAFGGQNRSAATVLERVRNRVLTCSARRCERPAVLTAGHASGSGRTVRRPVCGQHGADWLTAWQSLDVALDDPHAVAWVCAL